MTNLLKASPANLVARIVQAMSPVSHEKNCLKVTTAKSDQITTFCFQRAILEIKLNYYIRYNYNC